MSLRTMLKSHNTEENYHVNTIHQNIGPSPLQQFNKNKIMRAESYIFQVPKPATSSE